MPLVRRPLAAAMHLTAGLAASWTMHRAEAWAVASQRRSRENAMIAATRLAQRRVTAAEVASYVDRRAPGSAPVPEPGSEPGLEAGSEAGSEGEHGSGARRQRA